jgi:23S rRNA (guanosine2251-2'-O)-methyltransferase
MDEVSSESVVYGIHPVGELITTRLRQIDRIYFNKDCASAQLFDIIKLARKERLPYQMVPVQKLDQVSGFASHQGVVALCTVKEYTDQQTLLAMLSSKKIAPLLLVPASIEDPRNLGALIRTCVAFGVDALLLERKNTAPVGPTAAKVAAGMLERMCIVKPKSLEGLISTFSSQGYNVVGALAGAPVKPQDIDFTGPTIIITGGENRGIPPYLAKQCAHTVGIPIAPVAGSLNVSAAASILLYECARQRGFNFLT